MELGHAEVMVDLVNDTTNYIVILNEVSSESSSSYLQHAK